MNGVICEIVSTDENAALIDIWCVISGPGYLKFKVVKQITQIMNSYTFQIICWNYFFSSTSSQIFPHNRINYSCDFHNFTMTRDGKVHIFCEPRSLTIICLKNEPRSFTFVIFLFSKIWATITNVQFTITSQSQ